LAPPNFEALNEVKFFSLKKICYTDLKNSNLSLLHYTFERSYCRKSRENMHFLFLSIGQDFLFYFLKSICQQRNFYVRNQRKICNFLIAIKTFFLKIGNVIRLFYSFHCHLSALLKIEN
jgi:hypothetical protein